MARILAGRSKQAKRFLRNVCVITGHDFDFETLLCARCGRGASEDITVYLNGTLCQPIHDYSITKSVVTFTSLRVPGETITIIVHLKDDADVRTTIRVHKRSTAFKFRRTH